MLCKHVRKLPVFGQVLGTTPVDCEPWVTDQLHRLDKEVADGLCIYRVTFTQVGQPTCYHVSHLGDILKHRVQLWGQPGSHKSQIVVATEHSGVLWNTECNCV